jgi:hypothetical protein
MPTITPKKCAGLAERSPPVPSLLRFLPFVPLFTMPAAAPKSSARTKASPNGRPFYHRYLKAWSLAGGVIASSLLLGVLGYHFIARLAWVDALLNASMILSGMGPVADLPSDAAKIFASGYALFSGVVFISSTGIILSPVMHHVLHRFHIEKNESK